MFFKKKKPEPPPSEPLQAESMAPTAMSGGQSLFAPGLNPSTPTIDFGFSPSGQSVISPPPMTPVYPPPPSVPMASAEVISFESGLNTAMNDMAALANQPLGIPDESADVYSSPEPPSASMPSAEATFGFEQQWASPETAMPVEPPQAIYHEPVMMDPMLAAPPEPVVYDAYQAPPVMPEFVDPGLPQPQMQPPLQNMTPEQAWESFTPQISPSFETFQEPAAAAFEANLFDAGLSLPASMPSLSNPLEPPIPTAESATMAAFSDMPESDLPDFQDAAFPPMAQTSYLQPLPEHMPMLAMESTPSPGHAMPEQAFPSLFEAGAPFESMADEEFDAFHFSLEGDMPPPAPTEPVSPAVPSQPTVPVWEMENPTPPGTTFFATNEDYLKAKAAAFEMPEPVSSPSTDLASDSMFGLSSEAMPDIPSGQPFMPMSSGSLEPSLSPMPMAEPTRSANAAYEMGLDAAVAHGLQSPLPDASASSTDMDPFYMADPLANPLANPSMDMPTWDSFQVETTAMGSQPLTHSTAGQFLDSVNEQLYPADPFAATGGGDLMAGEQAFAEAAQILFPETMDAPLTWDEESSPATHESMANAGVYWPPMSSESDVVDLGPSFQATRGDLSDVPSAVPLESEPVSFEWTDETSLPASQPAAEPLSGAEEWRWDAELEPPDANASEWASLASPSHVSFTSEETLESGRRMPEDSLSQDSLPPAFDDMADANLEAWASSLNEPMTGSPIEMPSAEIPSAASMEMPQAFSMESPDYGLPSTTFEPPSGESYGEASILPGDEFYFALKQSDETEFAFMEAESSESLLPYGLPMTDATSGFAVTDVTPVEPDLVPEMPSLEKPLEDAAAVGSVGTRLGHLEILGVCMLDAEKRLLVVHNGDVFALMGQAGQDNPDVAVLRLFDSNPIAYQNTFTAVSEKRPDREGLYLVQVGTWRGVVSTYQDKMTLYTDLG